MKKRKCTIRVSKTKALICFAVTAKLICVFDFAYADCWFSHEAAHIYKKHQRTKLSTFSYATSQPCVDEVFNLIRIYMKASLMQSVWCCAQGLMPMMVWHLSHLMGKPTICIGENKDADQLRGNREADQRLCFRYSDSTIPLLLKSKI